MSTTIDNKVVEMRFDNKHFENNVRESMTTLEKLKEKLKFKDASKGFENLNSSANKVNMNGLSSALESCHSRFSALEIMGVTALANITNSAVNAGKRMISALTIDPIKTGLSEYETQINAIQTILSNTRSEGTNVEIVNKALDELNEYADQTIYNFTEMTKNIGTFTAAGVKLDTSVNAIKGIANLAAVSGSTSQQASTAMYQLSQALAAGKVSLMDWNSVVNAGMGGKVFQDALVRTSELLGTGAKQAIKTYGSFRESLTKGEWLTTEVLTETLNQLSGAYSKADLIAQGFSEKQADEIVALAKDAEDAATKVKTFTQLWDVLKETAQSGWAQTWRLLIGDFEQAKNLFSPLAKFLTGVIDGFSKARNTLLESALGKSFTGLLDKVKTSADGVKNIVKTVSDYGKVVDEIINGKWGNGQSRWDKLTEAGYDWAHAQNLVNEKLGFSLRRTTKYKETQDEAAKSQQKVNETTAEYIVQMTKLSDAELKAKGYTDDQIKAFRELEKAAKKTGIPLKDFIENIDEIDGRYLLVNSFKNLGMSLVSVFKSVGEAWRNAFPPMSGDTLFNIIAGFHKFSTVIRGKVEKNADELTRTLKGLFAIIDLISMVVGGSFKIAFTVLKTILGAFNLDILDFTAMVGDAIVGVRDWIENNNILVKGVQKIASYIVIAVNAIKKWVTTNETITKGVDKFKSKLDEVKKSLSNWTKGLKETDNIPKYIISGLVNGLKNGASIAIDAMVTLGKGLLEGIKKVLGIHSPSTEFFEIGKNIIQGLYNGISEMVKMVYNLLITIGGKLAEIVKNLDLGSIFTMAIGTGSVYGIVKIAKALEALTRPMETFADIGERFEQTLKKFNGVLSAVKFKIYAESVKTMATAIAILAGSIIVLTLVDQKKMWSAVLAIAALAAVLGILTAVSGKIGGKEGVQFGKLALTLLALGVSMMFMATALKTISNINPEKSEQAIKGFVIIIGSMMGLMAVANRSKTGFIKLGAAFVGMATALFTMAMVAKILGSMNPDKLHQGGRAIGMFSLIIVGLMAATKLLTGSKNVENIAKTIGKVGTAILMMAIVAKLLGSMNPDELKQGYQAILGFSLIIVGLMAATRLINGSKNVSTIGKAISGIAGAILMMAIVTRILGTMDPDKLHQGARAIGMFSLIIVGLMAATKLIGKGDNVGKIGRTLLMVSISIGIMGITAALLSLINIDGLKRGIIAVGFLAAFMAGLMFVTKFVPEGIMGILITLTVTIGILAIALGVLSAIDPSRLAGATAALGIVLGIFAIVIAVTSLVPTAMGTIIVITVAIGLLAGALIGLALLPVEQSLGAAKSLSLVLLSLSVVMGILALVGLGGPAALIGVGSLVAAIIAIGGLVIAIGALMDKFPQLESFLNKGIPIIEQIGHAIGSFFGNIVSGFATAAVSGLPEIGLMLSQFMTNVMPFITGMKAVDVSTLAGVGILGACIVALCAANFIEGITSFLTFGSSFADLGTQLSQFMINAMPFIILSKQIDPAIMTGVKTLAEAMLILTGNNILESLTSWLTGGNSLADFGAQLGGLGTSLNQFVTNLGTFTDAQSTTIDCACKAIKSLAQTAKLIPNEGGLWASIVGDNSLAKFGTYLPGLGTNLASFVTSLGTFTDAQVTTVDCAGKAIKALATSAKEIPNEGGLWGAICGDNSLAKFGSYLPGLGTNLASFVTNLGTFSEAQVTTVDCAGKAIKALADAAGKIPNEGGLWAKICGDNSLAKFGNSLPALGTNISNFVTNLGTFSEAQVTTITSAGNAIRAIAKLGEINIKDTSNGLKSLGDKMVAFAKKIKTFATEMGKASSENISSAVNKMNQVIDMAKSAAGTNIKSLNTFGDSLKKAATNGVNGFIKALTDKAPKDNAKKGAEALLQAFINGLGNKTKMSEIKKKAKSAAEKAVDAMCTKALKSDASDAGKDLVQGLINGLNNKDKRQQVYNAAFSLGQLAVQGEKDGQQSKSPSKATEQAGKWLGEGLIIGIKQMGRQVYDAGSNMGEKATSSISGALNTALKLINTDMDAQPTIRPVLDLSDVESGAGYLSTMFNNGPSIGVTSNLRAISSGVNTKLQNGANSDVVSALNKLRKDLGNVSGTTNNYNVNGITYDDGSNITDAVRTLVRAAKIERRV